MIIHTSLLVAHPLLSKQNRCCTKTLKIVYLSHILSIVKWNLLSALLAHPFVEEQCAAAVQHLVTRSRSPSVLWLDGPAWILTPEYMFLRYIQHMFVSSSILYTNNRHSLRCQSYIFHIFQFTLRSCAVPLVEKGFSKV